MTAQSDNTNYSRDWTEVLFSLMSSLKKKNIVAVWWCHGQSQWAVYWFHLISKHVERCLLGDENSRDCNKIITSGWNSNETICKQMKYNNIKWVFDPLRVNISWKKLIVLLDVLRKIGSTSKFWLNSYWNIPILRNKIDQMFQFRNSIRFKLSLNSEQKKNITIFNTKSFQMESSEHPEGLTIRNRLAHWKNCYLAYLRCIMLSMATDNH